LTVARALNDRRDDAVELEPFALERRTQLFGKRRDRIELADEFLRSRAIDLVEPVPLEAVRLRKGLAAGISAAASLLVEPDRLGRHAPSF